MPIIIIFILCCCPCSVLGGGRGEWGTLGARRLGVDPLRSCGTAGRGCLLQVTVSLVGINLGGTDTQPCCVWVCVCLTDCVQRNHLDRIFTVNHIYMAAIQQDYGHGSLITFVLLYFLLKFIFLGGLLLPWHEQDYFYWLRYLWLWWKLWIFPLYYLPQLALFLYFTKIHTFVTFIWSNCFLLRLWIRNVAAFGKDTRFLSVSIFEYLPHCIWRKRVHFSVAK